MKKLLLLTKTLLAAALLCVGQNAWGDVVYSWEGAEGAAKESGGTAAGTLNGLHTTVAGNLYAMQIAGNSSNIGAGGGVTITLTEALQEGDVIRVTGFQDKNASDKETALYMSFDQDATNKGNISDTENWVNLNTTEGCATGTQPETKIYTVTAALAGSNKLTLIRTSGKTGTNLFINKFQIYRNPTVNADINFSNAISDGAVAGTVNSMALSNTSGSQPFELGYTSGTPATTVLGDVLRVGNGTGTVTIEDSELARAKDIVVISFDMYFGKLGSKNAGFYLYDGSGVEIGSFYRDFYNGTTSTNTFGFDVSKITSVGKSDTENASICVNTNKTTFEIHLDYSTGKMYAVQSTNGTVKQKTTPVAMLSNNPIKKFDVKSNYGNSNRRCWFDNLKIQTYAGDYSSTKTITYNYKDNSDNDITDFMTSHGGVSSDTGEMDEEYTPTYPGSVTDNEYAYDYTYASGGDAFTITGDKTITLVYTKTAHPTTDVTVQYKNASSVYISDDIADDYPEGKPITYNLRKYVLDSTNGILYQTTDAMGTQHSPEAAETIVENVTATDINNVVFFAEGEEIATKSGTGESTIASRRYMGRFNSDSKICELGAGKYRFYAMMHCGNGTSGNVHATMYVKAGEEGIGSKEIMCRTNNQSLSFEFSITETKDILVQYGGGSNSGVDYIYIQKIGDVVKLNSAGYATYSANYDVEVSGAKAYTAVLDFGGKTITCSEITSNKVPAGNGVLLYGDANADVTLSITADAAALSTNNLKATTLADGSLATKGVNSYYALDGDTFKQYIGAAFVHNKAYFEVEGGAALARSMRIVFDGNITGVANVEAAAEAKAKEGKFIENGKLVIVKNGVKYNAAGAKLY